MYEIEFSSRTDANLTKRKLDEYESRRVNFNEILNNPVGRTPNMNFDENLDNIIDSNFVEEFGLRDVEARWEDVLRVVHLNAQGLNSSLDDIHLICRNSRPGIIGLCETFLNEKNQLLMDIPGYNSIFLNRKITKRGGARILCIE